MDVRVTPAPDWREAGWERLTARVGRRRLPVWDCTVGLVVGDEAALMIEAGSSLREGALLRAEAQRLLGGGRRVTHLALTHPHFDHVLGAAAFAGVEVFGTVGVDAVLDRDREGLRTDAVTQGLDARAAAEATDLLVLPRHLVSGERTLDLGGVQVLLANVGPGHTGHDLAVLVPGSAPGEPEVVFCGDLVEESGAPQAGPDAVPGRWPAALDRLLALGGADARYVPGHGAVVDAAFVRAQREELVGRFGLR
ncbi:MBL fold metallo-hydrolase [Streptomyces spectabilis]|uniref:Glyoxylase-like metal-dependent hydrolase (Beta-lactamase superfamily II) n=1 Tax=Streptomyces spectabilis TaxID=68270 RepID=A0A5P2X4L3_STRST|nr:MBL fold metallo-hydrolase [Streptomyces spectabilis]MBB5103452.1 glyoxylase-like metal-dependent hydrolase (beta-lactamase superfamily II) [Streptomyces spectabilis]MCI3902642.1 MBL fold metallo-hydrolase [Streptomyces spectabilis]QEV59963.1 MBL fold metallo-hydrolase [Streptomyces spectabilis]GGV49235.1 MBL fold hydrolase [Streptomyces spectabilis]